MNELQVFTHKELGGIRAMVIDGQPWFVGKDVAEVLGYEAERNALKQHVDDEDKLTHQISASGQNRSMTIINESGLYSLIMSSRLPRAKEFKRWVTSEVIPSIARTGFYYHGNEMEQIIKTVTETVVAQISNIVSEVVKTTLELVSTNSYKELPELDKLDEDDLSFYRKNLYTSKLASFPGELVEQVDLMLERMLIDQKLNFRKIERFCKASGYPISSVSVKKYFTTEFRSRMAD